MLGLSLGQQCGMGVALELLAAVQLLLCLFQFLCMPNPV
jgi:hypothetical protein